MAFGAFCWWHTAPGVKSQTKYAQIPESIYEVGGDIHARSKKCNQNEDGLREMLKPLNIK
jgi:hypothetical protein